MEKPERLDAALVARGKAESRAEACGMIAAGGVRVNGRAAGKPAQRVGLGDVIEVAGGARRFAGRGGEKLEAALAHWGVPVAGKRCLDVGASTGGFTDCLLQRGAVYVVAVDVGHGQMHARLRGDPRVEVREGCNARGMKPGDFPHRFDVVVVDVSFISLELVLPAVTACAGSPCWLVALVKPQFEAGRAAVGKGGVVRDAAARRGAVEKVRRLAEDGLGWEPLGTMESPLAGGDGNREYLLCARR